jgi:hypothetical protein
MGLLSSITDHFNKAEFSVAPNKKLKTLSKNFKESFNLTLVFYKGKQIADGDLTLKQLDSRTSKDVKRTASNEIKLKGSTKVGDAEKSFDKEFGVTVQIKDIKGKKLVPNHLTLGKAARGEY